MSLLDLQFSFDLNDKNRLSEYKKQNGSLPQPAAYIPKGKEKDVRSMIINQFRLGDLTMRKPRKEFNDLSLLTRLSTDQMAFDCYQVNNGDALEGDEVNAWKSHAMRPIVRNKIVSIAAHSTAKLIFPKLFAFDQQDEEQQDAAQVMEDLMEWAGQQCDYEMTSLKAILTALWSPISIVESDYLEVYKTVKRATYDDNGIMTGYKTEQILDEDYSGFKDEMVSASELFIENFYENDIQKQSWLIRRRVRSYDQMAAKYKKYANFQYVKPGVQVIYNEANVLFYEVYDWNLRGEMCEEVLYWNKALDMYHIMVNGVLLTDPENPNPRLDKLYPFTTCGYQYLDEGSKCFYYKSLAFLMQQDAKIVNQLYPMIIDAAYLNVIPPLINRGSEILGSDVLVPGATITLTDTAGKLEKIDIGTNLNFGLDALKQVEDSINDSTIPPIMSGAAMSGMGGRTAYMGQLLQNNALIILGLFNKMITKWVKDYGRLRKNDILQYLTIADVNKIVENSELVYKAFLLPNKNSNGKEKTRKIKFTANMPSKPMDESQALKESYNVLQEEGGIDGTTELYKVNPELFRDLKFKIMVSPDVLTPRSEELERALNLEAFDRAIQLPFTDQEALTKDLLFASYDKTKKDVNKYIKKEQPGQMGMPGQQLQGTAQGQQAVPQFPMQPMPGKQRPNVPLNEMATSVKSPLTNVVKKLGGLKAQG